MLDSVVESSTLSRIRIEGKFPPWVRDSVVEEDPHACAVTDRLRPQGQPMTPDTVADRAEAGVGVNECRVGVGGGSRRAGARVGVGGGVGEAQQPVLEDPLLLQRPLLRRCCSGFYRKTFRFSSQHPTAFSFLFSLFLSLSLSLRSPFRGCCDFS